VELVVRIYVTAAAVVTDMLNRYEQDDSEPLLRRPYSTSCDRLRATLR
jgi:hypothetical protein